MLTNHKSSPSRITPKLLRQRGLKLIDSKDSYVLDGYHYVIEYGIVTNMGWHDENHDHTHKTKDNK
jgi:hypothetical protein